MRWAIWLRTGLGYAGAYAKGQGQWRIPLATQLPGAVILAALITVLPQSPRWLVQKDRNEEAQAILMRLHGADKGAEYVVGEMLQISAQIRAETEHVQSSSFLELFHDATVVLAGSGVIQSYQSLFYEGLGFSGKTILLIIGFYGISGVVGQGLNLRFVSDRWGRARTMYAGCIVLAMMLSLLIAISRYYGSGGNVAGSSAGVVFVFLFSGLNALFLNSTTFTFAAEVLLTHLRSMGMGFALFCKCATSIWLSQVTPTAFAAISWRFYAVFIATLSIGAVFCAFFLPETKGLTLEEIAKVFGDEQATENLEDLVKNVQEKEDVEHMEHVETA